MSTTYPPIESRQIEILERKVPALSKLHIPDAQTIPYFRFDIPNLETLKTRNNRALILSEWKEKMILIIGDLEWTLQLPYYKFWSFFTNVPQFNDVLQDFLTRAPKFYDPQFESIQNEKEVQVIYNVIYHLVFRIYLRLSTYKESKEDHMSPTYWSTLLANNSLINAITLLDLCSLYECPNGSNTLLPKMINNWFTHIPSLTSDFHYNLFPAWLKKIKHETREIEQLVKTKSDGAPRRKTTTTTTTTNDIFTLKIRSELEGHLDFLIDQLVSIYKLLKCWEQGANWWIQGQSGSEPQVFELGSLYENNCEIWKEGLRKFGTKELRIRFTLWRQYFIQCFRLLVTGPTIQNPHGKTDRAQKGVDDYFEILTSCFEWPTLIYDYERTWPFRTDMQTLFSRGVVVDEQRIEYILNGIAASFSVVGKDYAASNGAGGPNPLEPKLTDPIYDPHFDLQLLGACAQEVTGFELESLITAVKDLLPDLPNSYIEVVLKHYGYSVETTINSLLESKVPAHLERYKEPSYAQASKDFQNKPHSLLKPIQTFGFDGPKPPTDRIPAEVVAPYRPEISTSIIPGLKLATEEITNKRKAAAEHFFDQGKMVADKTKKLVVLQQEEAALFAAQAAAEAEYNDEYDDTYDEAAVGSLEPDLVPNLNRRQFPEDFENELIEEEEETGKKLPFDAFCEDPAVLRERRAATFASRGRGGYRGGGGDRDVRGRQRGQGQDREVVHNRRVKDAAGSGHGRRKQADWKRREF